MGFACRSCGKPVRRAPFCPSCGTPANARSRSRNAGSSPCCSPTSSATPRSPSASTGEGEPPGRVLLPAARRRHRDLRRRSTRSSATPSSPSSAARRPRGRRRPGGPRRPADAGDARVVAEHVEAATRCRQRGPDAYRHQYRRSARRHGGRVRLHRHGRRRQHGVAAPGPGAAGGVLIGEATEALCTAAIAREPFGVTEIRGRQQVEQPWVVTGAAAAGSRPVRCDIPFVGRLDELACSSRRSRWCARPQRCRFDRR